jgi:hypothetical protein
MCDSANEWSELFDSIYADKVVFSDTGEAILSDTGEAVSSDDINFEALLNDCDFLDGDYLVPDILGVETTDIWENENILTIRFALKNFAYVYSKKGSDAIEHFKFGCHGPTIDGLRFKFFYNYPSAWVTTRKFNEEPLIAIKHNLILGLLFHACFIHHEILKKNNSESFCNIECFECIWCILIKDHSVNNLYDNFNDECVKIQKSKLSYLVRNQSINAGRTSMIFSNCVWMYDFLVQLVPKKVDSLFWVQATRFVNIVSKWETVHCETVREFVCNVFHFKTMKTFMVSVQSRIDSSSQILSNTEIEKCLHIITGVNSLSPISDNMISRVALFNA